MKASTIKTSSYL